MQEQDSEQIAEAIRNLEVGNSITFNLSGLTESSPSKITVGRVTGSLEITSVDRERLHFAGKNTEGKTLTFRFDPDEECLQIFKDGYWQNALTAF